MNPPTPGTLVVLRLTKPESWWRRAIPAMPCSSRLALFDSYYELAETLKTRPGGLSDPRRRRNFADLMDFAWHLNDLVAELHADRRRPRRRTLPGYARGLLQARKRGKVPLAVNGVHVSIGRQFGYASAAPGAFVAVPGRDLDAYDFSVLAGLDVEILACAVDYSVEIDVLAGMLARQGVRSVRLRRIDAEMPVQTIYDAERPWRR